MMKSNIWLMALAALGQISWRTTSDSPLLSLIVPDFLYKLSGMLRSHSQNILAA